MLRHFFKRSSHKKTEDPNHQAFVAAYTAIKPQCCTTTQEGKPKEYILFNVGRLVNESYASNKISGPRDLLLFIKNQKASSTDDTNNETMHVKLANGIVAYKKNVAAHKNEQQFIGPYLIVEYLHGDSYLISKATNNFLRLIGTPEKCNARLLKLAPNILQRKPLSLTNDTALPTLSHAEEIIVSDPGTSLIKRGRGRQRKNLSEFQKSTTPNPQPLTSTSIEQPPLQPRKHGRPRKNK